MVVGWCDIIPDKRAVTSHRATLGMGLLPTYRGRGLGRPLLLAALEAAAKVPGLARVELGVFGSNTRAQRLYESVGFVVEGTRRDAARIGGVSFDEVLMAMALQRP